MNHLPIAIAGIRPSIVTLEVSGIEPAAHDLGRAFAEAGVNIVFSETWLSRLGTRERFHVTNRGGRAFTKHQLDEMLVLAARALGSRTSHSPSGAGPRAVRPTSPAWRRMA